MKKILIIKCSLDDDDGEMAQMANSIEVFQQALGNQVTVDNMKDGSELDQLIGRLAQLGSYNEVVFTGHSRFFEVGSRFITPVNYRVRPLSQRRAGGFKSEDLARVVVQAVMKSKAKSIMFCCCEIATSVDAHERNDNGAKEILLDFPRNGEDVIRRYLMTPQGDAKVSLLFDIAAKVQSLLRANAYVGEVTLKGLNGVGYIVGDKPEYLSFSQEHFSKYDTIRKRQAKAKVMTNDDEFLNEYVLKNTNKKSAHVLGFKIAN